jgi:Lrp/AsnC family leucine-responsive transcriptional regulator
MKVMATSMQDLERIAGQVGTLGAVTTSVVYSTPLPPRPLLPPTPGTGHPAPGTRHLADSAG